MQTFEENIMTFPSIAGFLRMLLYDTLQIEWKLALQEITKNRLILYKLIGLIWLINTSASLGEKSIMDNGVKSLGEQEKRFQGFYNELDMSNTSNFVQSFENALTKFMESQQDLKNSPDDVHLQFQVELRTKWNYFASMLNDSTVYKLPTAEKSLFDIRL